MIDNKILSQSLLRRLCAFALAVPLAAAILSSCFVSPIYIQISNDILYADSILPDIMGYAVNLLDIIFASAQYAAVIISFLLFPAASYRRAVRLICVGATITYRVLNQAVDSITDGSDFLAELNVMLVYIVLETLEFYAVVFVSSLFCREAVKRFSMLRTASRRLGDLSYDWTTEILPYHGIVSKNDPVQMTAMISAAIFMFLKIVSRLIYDINYGAPDNASQIIQMIIGYTSDVIGGILIYAFVLLFCAYFIKLVRKPAQQAE